MEMLHGASGTPPPTNKQKNAGNARKIVGADACIRPRVDASIDPYGLTYMDRQQGEWRQREIVRGVGDAAPYGLLLQLRYTIVYHFLQKFTMILQFAAGNAIIGKKAREQLLNTQLFPFLRPMRTAPALRLARGAAN